MYVCLTVCLWWIWIQSLVSVWRWWLKLEEFHCSVNVKRVISLLKKYFFIVVRVFLVLTRKPIKWHTYLCSTSTLVCVFYLLIVIILLVTLLLKFLQLHKQLNYFEWYARANVTKLSDLLQTLKWKVFC